MKRMLIYGILFFLLFLFPPQLNALLNIRDYDLIKVAYMNGCFRALSVIDDKDKLTILREKPGAAMEFVLNETDQYMKKVSELNKE